MSNPSWNANFLPNMPSKKKPLSLNKYKFRAYYFGYLNFNSKKEMHLSDLHNQFYV